MKFKRVLFILVIIVLSMALFACNFGGKNNKNETPTQDGVPILPDLTDYSADTKYYNVLAVTYSDTGHQEALLRARIDERKNKDDLSVPLKIFVESEPSEIILAMGRAALNYDKMDKTVNYLAGVENENINLDDDIVNSGVWNKGEGWSFFDDWDYYEKLRDKADNSSNDRDSDNAMRQRRKIMKKIYEIGLSGDEFGRLIYEEMRYIVPLTENDMFLGHNSKQGVTIYDTYDAYVKAELSHDALVYFKAYKQFSTDKKSSVVQLYGYYYDFNKKSYESTDDETFEKELAYSHKETFTNKEWLDYLDIQRNHYVKAYRYSSEFYKKFYDAHFKFQDLIETFDIEVYQMGTAFPNSPDLKYTTQLKRGMEYGFAQQLKLSDHLYIYSKDEDAMIKYNEANSNYELAKKGGSKPDKDEKEFLYNMEQLKVVDYVLNKMSDSELTGVLRYQIMTYSGDMIKNVQSEKKDNVLDQIEYNGLVPGGTEAVKLAETIGRRSAIIAQIRNNHQNADPENQLTTANDAPWKGMRVEINDTLKHDYSKYENGSAKKEAFEDLLIKREWVYNGTSYAKEEDLPDGAVAAKKEYDTNHMISRFLNAHEVVMRHMAGQVEVQTYAKPSKGSNPTTYTLQEYSSGTYICGIGGNMPDGVTPQSYVNTFESYSFKVGKTMEESMEEEDKPNFLSINIDKAEIVIADEEEHDSQTTRRRKFTYVLVGWYIDSELKYEVDISEKVKYDLVYYPGYKVVITDIPN